MYYFTAAMTSISTHDIYWQVHDLHRNSRRVCSRKPGPIRLINALVMINIIEVHCRFEDGIKRGSAGFEYPFDVIQRSVYLFFWRLADYLSRFYIDRTLT